MHMHINIHLGNCPSTNNAIVPGCLAQRRVCRSNYVMHNRKVYRGRGVAREALAAISIKDVRGNGGQALNMIIFL